MKNIDSLEKWITDSEEILEAVNEGHLDPDSFTDERAGQALAALRAVLDVHEGAPNSASVLYPVPACNECGQTMPCRTVRAVQAVLGEEA